MNEAQVLRAAADYIDDKGWVQGASGDGAGRVCAVSATRMTGWLDALSALSVFVGGRRGSVSDVIRWNDDPSTTQELVTKTMRACADAIDDVQR